MQSWSALPFNPDPSVRSWLVLHFQTCRAACRQTNWKTTSKMSQTKDWHEPNPNCILPLTNTIPHKDYSNTFKQNEGRTLPILSPTEHDVRFQMDYLRKMVICKHLQRPAFPSGAWEGSTDTSPHTKTGWQVFPLCKHCWEYIARAFAASVHVF